MSDHSASNHFQTLLLKQIDSLNLYRRTLTPDLGKNEVQKQLGKAKEENECDRQKKFFYDIAADVTLHFKSGNTLKINKAMLGFLSPEFQKMFFDFESKTDFTIDEFDLETFETFLNCLLGFRPYAIIDALLIFPIAHKYEVEKSLKFCIKILKPTVMTENVCLTLNLTLFYKCNELTTAVLAFLKNNFGIINVIEQEKYCFLLEPASMLELLKYIKMDSYLLEKIYLWGKNYLNNQNKEACISSFFKEQNILKNIPLEIFESCQSLFDFHESVTVKSLLSADEIFLYLKANLLKGVDKVPNRSIWMQMKENSTCTEHFDFKPPFHIKALNKSKIKVTIKSNNIVSYDVSSRLNLVGCKISCLWRDLHQDGFHEYDYSKEKKTEYIFKCDKIMLTDKKIVYAAEMPVPCSYYYFELASMDVTYTFSVNCRILKTSLNVMPYVVDDSNLYFTFSVDCKGIYNLK